MKPLNGTKTHPLSDHALFCLRCIAEYPRPKQDINPGVVNRLLRGELIEIVDLPSPFKTHNRRPISHARITELGLSVMADKPTRGEDEIDDRDPTVLLDLLAKCKVALKFYRDQWSFMAVGDEGDGVDDLGRLDGYEAHPLNSLKVDGGDKARVALRLFDGEPYAALLHSTPSGEDEGGEGA